MISSDHLEILRNAGDEMLLHLRTISSARLEGCGIDKLAKVEYELYNVQALGIMARRIADRIHKHINERQVTHGN